MLSSDFADGCRSGFDQPAARQVGPLDRFIGAKIQEHRRVIGLSRCKLGKALGFTGQQMRKYELGESRIAASTLYTISQILKVPITSLLPEDKTTYTQSQRYISAIADKLNDVDDTQFLTSLHDFITVAVDRAGISKAIGKGD